MHALQLASGTPSALLDWNNNYGDDPDKAVCFHCSNLPKHFFRERRAWISRRSSPARWASENTYRHLRGPGEGRADELRPLLDQRPRRGRSAGYVGEGEFTDDPLDTFGGAGVVRIPNLQGLLRYICENGFEHHVAANLSAVATAVEEAASRYLGAGQQVPEREMHNSVCGDEL